VSAIPGIPVPPAGQKPTPEQPADLGTTLVEVGGKSVDVSQKHFIDQAGQSVIDLLATVGQGSAGHRITIGSDDEPLPEGYDLAQLEAHLAEQRTLVAALAYGRDRAASLVAQLASRALQKGEG